METRRRNKLAIVGAGAVGSSLAYAALIRGVARHVVLYDVDGVKARAITAGAKQKPGESRMDLAASTVGLMKKVIPPMVERSPDALFLMVTNPVDVTTYAALKISGLPRNQLFGSGTVLDSSRLRVLVAQPPTTPSASRGHASSKRCSTTSTGCCQSPATSRGGTASLTCACRCPPSSIASESA